MNEQPASGHTAASQTQGAGRSTASDGDHAVVMRGVSRHLGDHGKRVLDGIDFSLSRGGVTTLVGPSGAGKSSLIRLINRLDEATAGSIAVLGRPLDQWPVSELRRRAAMVFQEPSLLGLTVRENLAIPFRLQGGLPADLDRRMLNALESAELTRDVLDRNADELSVGQKQRAALARSLITGPELLLLDEPTSALDPRTAERLLDCLLELNRREGVTLLIASHRFDDAQRLGGRLAVLIEGQLRAEGETERILAHPPEEDVAAFLSKPRTPSRGS